jgi:hypothetical protein
MSSEKKIFRLFQESQNLSEWVGLHSLRLDWHLTQIEGEIDFLIIGKSGVFVVEVKGGRLEFDGNIWTSMDRNGTVHTLKRAPMRQAADSMWSLRTMLAGPKFPEANKVAKKTRWGWFVVFPDCTVTVGSPEWHPKKVLNSPEVANLSSFTAAFQGVIDHHISQDPHHEELSFDEVNHLAQMCRPIFDTVPSLKEELLRLDEVAMALTSDQYRVLDSALENPRLICIGGAGTGKTLVALEVARRRRDEGQSVILTCGSRPLLDLLARQPRVDGVRFVQWSQLSQAAPCDFLVVDEAQDFIGSKFEDSVSKVLPGGLVSGEWFISLDPNRQAGLIQPFDNDFFEILKSYAAVLRLKTNVRNTMTVIAQTQWATKADLGADGTGTGPQVVWAESNDRSAEGDLIAIEIRRLLDHESTHPSEIAVLYLNPNEQPEFSEKARQSIAVPLLDVNSAPHLSGITFASAAEFKGLERQAILICGARNLDKLPNPINHLYTAMSRARGFLWIATTNELGSIVENASEEPVL